MGSDVHLGTAWGGLTQQLHSQAGGNRQTGSQHVRNPRFGLLSNRLLSARRTRNVNSFIAATFFFSFLAPVSIDISDFEEQCKASAVAQPRVRDGIQRGGVGGDGSSHAWPGSPKGCRKSYAGKTSAPRCGASISGTGSTQA